MFLVTGLLFLQHEPDLGFGRPGSDTHPLAARSAAVTDPVQDARAIFLGRLQDAKADIAAARRGERHHSDLVGEVRGAVSAIASRSPASRAQRVDFIAEELRAEGAAR
jgi:hypothetical protein